MLILPLLALLLARPVSQAAPTTPAYNLTVTTIHVFGGPGDGLNPVGTIVPGPSSLFYGCTEEGGKSAMGSLYSIDALGNEKVLHDFGNLNETQNDGQYPYAGPTFVGTTLYGSTFRDTSLSGTVWTSNISGAEYPIYISANWDCQQTPTYAGGLLYVPTGVQGTSGAIFKMQTNGQNIVDVHDFGKVANDGLEPSSALFDNPADGYLYGTTSGGGKGGQGVIYRLLPGGSGYQIVHNFQDGTVPYDGNGAIGICAGPGGVMIGICSGGGKYGGGTLFELNAGVVTILHNFADPSSPYDGSIPSGLCAVDTDGTIWGTSRYGGSAGAGTLYRYDPVAKTIATIHSFADGSVTFDGAQPIGGIVRVQPGVFMGTCYKGSPSLSGCVWKVAFQTATGNSLFLKSVAENPTAVVGGYSTTGTAVLSSASNQLPGITVKLSSNNANATVPASVYFPIGISSVNFPITTKIVTAATAVTITGTLNAVTRTTSLTVNPRPNLVVVLVSVPANVASGTPTSGTVTMNIAPLAATVVSLKSAAVSASVLATVTVPANSISASFPITTKAVTLPTHVAITASYNGSAASGSLGLDGLPSLTLSAPSITGGTGPLSANYNIGYFAPYSGTISPISGSASATVPASGSIAAGQSSVTIPVTVLPVTTDTVILIEGLGPFIGYPGTLPIASGSFTDLAPRATLTCTNSPVKSGTPANFKIQLTGPIAAGGFSTSTIASDSGLYSATIHLAAGATSATFSLDSKALPTSHIEVVKLSGFSGTGVCTMILAGVPALTASPNPVVAGNTSTATVTLGAMNVTTPFNLTVTANSTEVTVPTTVAVPVGAHSVTFPIVTKATAKTAAKQVVVITVTGNSGAVNVSYPLTVNPTT
jgi:uncharacterized repeat protein (TIGR03803 family)